MQALNVVYPRTHMTLARSEMFQIPANWRESAFSQLPPDDKLRIIDILALPPDTKRIYYNFRHSRQWVSNEDAWIFNNDLKKWAPIITNALADKSIPLEQRWVLVNGIVKRLDRTQVDDNSYFELLSLQPSLESDRTNEWLRKKLANKG